jgi:phosphatidate cytidylyltransferase
LSDFLSNVLLLFLADPDQATELAARVRWLAAGVLTTLIVSWAVGYALRHQPESTINPALVKQFNRRINAWWLMCAILVVGFLLGKITTTVFFFLASFWALREFITMTPTRRGDHRALLLCFIFFTPLQYLLIGFMDRYPSLYGLYTVMIPVYASLFIPAQIAFSGDPKRFLERSAKIQAGLLICVYALSHAPAILYLGPIKVTETEEVVVSKIVDDQIVKDTVQQRKDWNGSRSGLLFYFVLVTQLGDLFQFLSSKLLGRHVIAPNIHAGRTWEGFVLGVVCTAGAGAMLWWVTPFQMWESALMSAAIAFMGFAGGMTMSAIKRDRGVRDYGTLVTGHAGVLDRIDSICFAAPVFFHLTRYYFAA